ncbi:type II and III secretion system protein family protein [Hephaestia sp. GCM10023244]|uniref:type II and III secretion system protein family protein n=1 Tax=unclassified Hephaestia TaxID=2631281 RepID=UPI0020770608|nr:type II and III secretion system protein family protein [Hephaestia sp. MAHUQ-44]MCM8729439.1 type II and III secretion system protein family protein [Hephaestia sp. MAHUQ-44]
MRITSKPIGWPLAVALAAGMLGTAPAPSAAQTVSASPSAIVQINTGRGRLVTLPAPMSDLFVADPGIADVQVRSPTQLYVFGKAPGETTVYATTKAGKVVYSSTIQVGNNIDSVQQMLLLAMPDARVTATPMNGLMLLTGTVAAPDDAAEAERLVQAFVGDKTQVLSRLRTATPLQVNLQVRIAEVSKSFIKNFNANLLTRDTTGGFSFGIGSGRSPGTIGAIDVSKYPTIPYPLPGGGTTQVPYDLATGKIINPANPGTAYDFSRGSQQTMLGFAGKLLGLDVLSSLDLGETSGQVTTLANPNLTALSGETATFLAGGEIPIPLSQGLGTTSVEYKQYGVSLAYTPTVLSDGRISLRVRPEVSELDYANAVQVGGTSVPGLTTRRTETTVELGSGQSFVIAGLLSNSRANTIEKAPGLGDVPVLGALFRSNGWKRNETELVIVITPYLVKPINANQVVLPTDGYQEPTDLEHILLGNVGGGKSGAERPKPTVAAPGGAPSIGAVAPVSPGTPPPSAPADRKAVLAAGSTKTEAAPGFSLN